MKWKILSCCGEKEGLCSMNINAYGNLIRKFDVWNKVSDVVWSQYLVVLQKNSLTGVWAKEVIKELIKGETETENVR